MARYRLLELAFIGDRLREPSEEIDYDGIPGLHLQPLDATARKAMKAAEAAAAAEDKAVESDGEEAAPLELI